MWRISLIAQLKDQLGKLKTDGHLQEAILSCVDKALAGTVIQATPGPHQVAYNAQEAIGWLGLIRGYWAKKWQHAFETSQQQAQDETDTQRKIRERQMPRWQAKVVQTLWHGLIQLWQLRNEERHGRDAESREAARRSVIHHDLAEIYGRQQQYPQRVQKLLRRDYNTHILESITKLEDWVDAYKGTFAITWAPD